MRSDKWTKSEARKPPYVLNFDPFAQRAMSGKEKGGLLVNARIQKRKIAPNVISLDVNSCRGRTSSLAWEIAHICCTNAPTSIVARARRCYGQIGIKRTKRGRVWIL